MVKYVKTLVPLPETLTVVISGVAVYESKEVYKKKRKIRFVGTLDFHCICRGKKVDVISAKSKKHGIEMGSSFFQEHLKSKKEIKQIERICEMEIKRWYRETLKWRKNRCQGL